MPLSIESNCCALDCLQLGCQAAARYRATLTNHSIQRNVAQNCVPMCVALFLVHPKMQYVIQFWSCTHGTEIHQDETGIAVIVDVWKMHIIENVQCLFSDNFDQSIEVIPSQYLLTAQCSVLVLAVFLKLLCHPYCQWDSFSNNKFAIFSAAANSTSMD